MIETRAAMPEGEALEGMARGIVRLAGTIEAFFQDPQVAAAFEAWKEQRRSEACEAGGAAG